MLRKLYIDFFLLIQKKTVWMKFLIQKFFFDLKNFSWNHKFKQKNSKPNGNLSDTATSQNLIMHEAWNLNHQQGCSQMTQFRNNHLIFAFLSSLPPCGASRASIYPKSKSTDFVSELMCVPTGTIFFNGFYYNIIQYVNWSSESIIGS